MSKTELIYGTHAVLAMCMHAPERIRRAWVVREKSDRALDQVIAELTHHGISREEVDRKVLDERASGGTHQGVIAEITAKAVQSENSLYELLDALEEPPFLLVLDSVQDPHNLGACLRTADTAGVHAVVIPKDRAVGLTPTVRKVACGAAETTTLIQVTNLARCLRELKERGIWIAGTADSAKQSIYDANLTGPMAVVMGSEGKGVRQLIQKQCDLLLRIPMQGSVSSLNVSVATGVVLFEAYRQRDLSAS